MKSFSWLRKVFAHSTFGRRVPYRKAPRPTARGSHALRLEQLEDRTLLSTYTVPSFDGGTLSQLNNASSGSFLGGNFDTGNFNFGPGIADTVAGDFGYTANASIKGKAGLSIAFTGDGGTVAPKYTGVTLNQSFTQPTGFGQVVSFNPQNTNVNYGTGSLTTSTPSFGYGADLILDAQGSIGGDFAFFKDFGGSTYPINGNLDIPLFAVNENNSGAVDLLGMPMVGATKGDLSGVGKSLTAAIQNFLLARSLNVGITEDPPIQMKVNFSTPSNDVFTQDLQLQLGLIPAQVGPYVVSSKYQFIPNVAADLGSLTEEVPTINLNGGFTTTQTDGTITASDQSTVAQLSLQAGALGGAMLGLAGLADTDSINLGPLNAQFTPVSFQLQPTLTAAQTVTLQPVSRLTYTFTDPNNNNASMTADVILNGQDIGQQSSVTFTPGQDTVGIQFEGKPIHVTPTWSFAEALTNEVDLDVNLDATLTVCQLTVNVPGTSSITLGPLYQQKYQFTNTKLMTLFDNTTVIPFDPITLSGSDQSFTIGSGFHLNTTVSGTADANATGSLRYAVLSADSLAGTTIIQLGAGTYQLTRPPTQPDGTDGNLLVKQGTHLIIEGAGAGKTIIQGDFGLQKDRLFDVQSGANLTLDGLTLEDGDSANSLVGAGEAGGILGESGSTIDVENCDLTGNAAPGFNDSPLTLRVDGAGGAIASFGTLTVNDSTIDHNSALSNGGGIFVYNGTLNLRDSTVASNTLSGGYENFGTSSPNLDCEGAGLGLMATAATIDGCTFTNNVINTSLSAEGGGVSIGNDTQNVLIDNSTFVGNSVTGDPHGSADGGAIFSFNFTGNVVLVGDTITGNSASNGIGGISASAAQGLHFVILKNTIVADNHTSTGTVDLGDVGGDRIGSLGNNLIGSTGPSVAPAVPYHNLTFTGTTLTSVTNGWDPTDQVNVGAGLAAAGNNGGPTQTEAISTTGPEYGKGGTTVNVPGVITQLPATDQRGYARITNGEVDIGAFQYQYDLAVTGGVSAGSSGTLTYTFTLTNNGPDAAPSALLDDLFPSNSTVVLGPAPNGWLSVQRLNHVGYVHTTPLAAGQSATFGVTVIPSYQPGQPFLDTATAGPSDHDNDTANSAVTLAVQPATEDQALRNTLLYHFLSPNPADTAANFNASVDWGDGSPVNSALDGTGTVSVVPGANGGFDVLGSHLYADEANYTVAVNVTDLGGGTVKANVFGQTTPVASTLAAPLPTPGGKVTNAVLLHFNGIVPTDTPASYTPTVIWGDGAVTGRGTGITIVADPAGGFDVVGSHTFAATVVGTVIDVQVSRNFAPIVFGPVILHVPGATANAGDRYTATWGDGTTDTASGPSGSLQLSVEVNPGTGSGYDLIGGHDYTRGVTTFSATAVVTVADAALTGGAATPGVVLSPQTTPTSSVLYRFTDPDTTLTASDFTATVHWGGLAAVNTSADGSGNVSVVADNGGWDVVGKDTYYVGVATVRSVTVTDSDGRVFYSPGLFHFTDADPLATAADFSATVNWGDGVSNNLTDGDNAVYVVADPAGGFDVLGNHIYGTHIRNGTFSVSVTDDGGATANASVSPFNVDYALTAGTLTTPAVTTEGNSISNALLFHFTDGDTQGTTTDFTATVLWGDGTSNTSADGAGKVTVSAHAGGGFDVFGTHTFGEVPSGSTFGVLIQDVSGATTGASTTTFSVADPSVSATGGLSLTPNENADPGARTVATFTDPAAAEAVGDYAASIRWGDGTPDSSGAITYDSTTGTFTVKGDHVYSQAGSDTITVTIHHDQSAAVQVTDTATVAEVAASVIGNSFSLTKVYGQSVSSQAVGTFTDAGGAGPLSGYTATIDWGDNSTAGTGTVGYDTAAPFTYASNLPAGNGPSAVAVADLNGDSKSDIVVANAADDDVLVYLGNGDGSFQAPVSYSLGAASPTALAIADLGNGHLDIVTANSGTGTVSVLLGDGTGSFGTATTLTAGANPSAIVLANLGNGHIDIVTANRGGNTVSVFLGNGTGTFGTATNFAAGSGPDGLAVGDVNGDAKADLVVADAGSDSVSVLIGNGDGTFNAPTSVAVGGLPSAVALARLSGTGPLDVVTANAAGGSVSVLIGNGNGTFQAAVNYAVGAAPSSLLVRDANGDGKPDVVTANEGDNNVSVLPGNGDGTFGTATNYGLAAGATAPVALAAGDLDGAGVPDLVTANSLTDNVTLLLPPYTVTGSHSYSAVSPLNTPYQVQVTVAHGGTSATASTGTVAVTPATLSITADDQTMTYGGSLPTLTATFNGLVNGDQPSAVTGLSLSTVAATSHVGDYTITASGATDSNYTITLNNGTLHITAAPLTITADNKTMPYGGTLPALTVSYSGLTNGDTPATFGTAPNTAPTVGTTATSASHVSGSPYAITVSGASDNDYSITYMQGGLTVTPVALTITADDKTMVYGTSLPTYTATYGTFVNGEGAGNLTGTLSVACPALPASGPGAYTITPSGQSSTDYTITYKTGTLTITPAPLSAAGVNISATAGAPFAGTVATFTNADPYGGAGSYTATIFWGDGSSSAGTITAGTGGTLIVSGAHTYGGAASLAVSVRISHNLGYTTTATTSATATITGLGAAVQKGQGAGIGYWHNKNGQALIAGFGITAAGQSLANWLATTFPHLFGNLAGMTNAQVASYYLTQFGQSGPKLGAEVMATALNVYATTSSLGGAAGQAYGFTVSAYGLGASSYNVGGNGAAFGVANNTTLNVYQLLQAADLQQGGKGVLYGGNGTLIADAVNVFDGINSAGGF